MGGGVTFWPFRVYEQHRVLESRGLSLWSWDWAETLSRQPPCPAPRPQGRGDEIMSAQAAALGRERSLCTFLERLLPPACSAHTISFSSLDKQQPGSIGSHRLALWSCFGFPPSGPGACLRTGAGALNYTVSTSQLSLQMAVINESGARFVLFLSFPCLPSLWAWECGKGGRRLSRRLWGPSASPRLCGVRPHLWILSQHTRVGVGGWLCHPGRHRTGLSARAP